MDVALEQGLAANQFKSSPSWMKGFMKRWGLAIRAKTRSGQANFADDGEKALAEFKASICKDNRIIGVFNADQTGINYECLPKQTMDNKGAKLTVWINASGHDKDRVTAMLLADTKGTKYPLFLVLKSKASTIKPVVQEKLTQRHGFGRQVWKEIEDLEANFPLQIYGNPSAWCNASISLRFLDFHFGHRLGQAVDPVLLLWDDFSAHFIDEVVERARYLQVHLYRVAPTFTWICQPADVAWMKPIKASIRRKWVDYLRRSIALSGRGGGTAFRLKCPELWDIVEWISDVWDEVPTTIIVKGFEKCLIVDPGTALVDHALQYPEDSGGDDILQDLCDSGVFEALDPEDDVSLTLAECID
ncbi:hypothetical protein B5M09_013904 [Aphanomyces astaci]|uniref:DDE-1 domain-containing protein n=1 Tax=Aphanomyces astaci TaxID=112090 RepID=A0A3R7Z4B6_APHAT|nr:hypothetical protein B5M09_013904 [Aphanomyces astaci]